MLDHLSNNKFDVENKVIILSSSKSHFHDKVLIVFNSGTKQFIELEEHFDLVDFRTSLDLNSTTSGNRGNKQVNAGFTSQSLSTRCPATGVAQPSMFTGTLDLIPAFEALSTLAAQATSSIHDSFSVFSETPETRSSYAAFRHAKFAGTISPHNTMEYIAPTMNDKENPLVVAHVDNLNDPEAAHSVSITASRLLVVVASPSIPPELKRVVQIGTQRKPCADFMHRVRDCGTLVLSLHLFHQSLPPHSRYFNPELYFSETVRRTWLTIDGNCLLSPANADRCIHESAISFCTSYFVEHGNPQSIQEVYEVVLGSLYVTEPRKYMWMVKQ